jgi:CDP-glycerol glycerophosphotransferase
MGLKYYIKKLLFYIFRVFPINKMKIVLINFNGKGYGDSPKSIAEYLHRSFGDAIDIIWLTTKGSVIDTPSWIRNIELLSIKSIYELVTAKVWVNNSRSPRIIEKRINQYYIMTWHGSIGVKKVEVDAGVALPESWIRTSKHDSLMADLFVSGSRFGTELYRRAFWYDGPILEAGTPRCDILFNANKKNKVHKYYNIPQNVKFLLYAPTFRKNHENVYNIDFERVIQTLEQKFYCDVKVLIRMHPAVMNEDYGFIYNDDIFNATIYPDMYELLAECDFLITDYSSSMMEAGYIYKPCWLYAPDIRDYEDDRGFYFQLSSLPFKTASNNDELESLIKDFEHERYKSDVISFFDSQGICENGHATEILCEYIIEKMTGKKGNYRMYLR